MTPTNNTPTTRCCGNSFFRRLTLVLVSIFVIIMAIISIAWLAMHPHDPGFRLTSLSQYYDQPLRCFTFEDFQLVPTVKKFEEILGCPLGGRKPYLFSRFYPSTTRVAKVVKISAQELDRVKQNRNGVVGVPRKCLEERAKALANQGEWAFFY